MTLETFFEKFDQFADAPGAVAKMRELVRHLAVTGKLVAQDPSDESGELLLKQIHAERQAAVKARRIGPMKPLPGVGDDELLFELQAGWAAARLIELVMEIQTGPFGSSLHKSDYQLGGTPVINPASLKDGKIVPIDEMAIGHATLKRLEVFKLSAGDIVMARRGEMGRCAIVTKTEEGWLCGTGSLVLRMPRSLYAPYLAMLIGAPMARTYLGGASVGTTMQNLNQSILAKMPVGVPPLAEQKRIVAKVDELMALCDRLEAQQQEREEQASKLARASLARFADAPTPANLPFLFHPSYAIPPADLRKSILTLAVQGKLVPQDPNDEPAEEQLETIQARKAELVRKQVIKKSDPSHPVDPDEVDHDIPDSWAWVRLVEICELITDGTHLTPKYTESGRMFLSAQNVKPFKFMPAKHRFVSEEHYQGYVKNRKPERGDVLLTRVGAGIGEAATIDQDLDFAIYVSLGLVRPVRGFVFSDYITLWLNSPDGTEKSSRNTYGKGVSQGNLNLSLIRNFLVPLPPLAEQRRIVAKVEQLMALVDALETQLAASRATAANLLSALVAELTTA